MLKGTSEVAHRQPYAAPFGAPREVTGLLSPRRPPREPQRVTAVARLSSWNSKGCGAAIGLLEKGDGDPEIHRFRSLRRRTRGTREGGGEGGPGGLRIVVPCRQPARGSADSDAKERRTKPRLQLAEERTGWRGLLGSRMLRSWDAELWDRTHASRPAQRVVNGVLFLFP